MMLNIEVGTIVEIAKGRQDEWGWMIYYTNAQGQKGCAGVYTDPAKLLVDIGKQLLGKTIHWSTQRDETIIYTPSLEVVVYDDGGKKIGWSTQRAETEKKLNEQRAKALNQMAK